jgi:peptide/nickel transport system substrate-binding protein
VSAEILNIIEKSASRDLQFSRRAFAGLATVGAMGALLSPMLSACTQPTGTNDSNADNGTNQTNANDSANTGKTSQVTIAMGASSEPEAGFDPFFGWGCGEHGHEPLIQSTLVTTTLNMGFANDLATSYSCSEDGLTWTFKIRDDVKFSNGITLTAKDIAFTLEGIRDSKGSQTDLSMIKNVDTPDEQTVIINLEKPYNALLYTLALIGIVPAQTYDSNYGEKPIGSGRYLLEQWDRGQQVILVANPDYYGEAPKMQRVVVVFMAEDASLAAARSGQVDLAYTSATFSSQQLNGYSILACQSVDSRGISLPTQEPKGSKDVDGVLYPLGNAITSDIAIRRALNMATNRDLMVENVLNGYGTPAFSVSDGMPWASKEMILKTDIQAAKQVLSDAGWVLGSDGILVKDTLRAQIDLYYPANDTVRQALASEFSNQIKEIGIQINVHGLSWDELYAHSLSDPILWGWGSNSPAELYSLYHSEGSANFPSYYNDVIDEHLDAALSTNKIEDSYAIWQSAEWDGSVGVAPQGAATWVWFANIDHLYFKRDNLIVAKQKLHPHGHGWSVVNNVDQWTWQ